MRTEVSQSVHHSVVEASLAPRLFETIAIRFYINKLERVGGHKLEIHQLVARLQQAGDAAARVETEMVSTLGTDLQVIFEIFLEK